MKTTIALCAFAGLLVTSQMAQAAPSKAAQAFAKEPKVAEVVDVAMRYFRVHPEVLDSLRSKSHGRAVLPLLTTGLRLDDDRFNRSEAVLPNPVNTEEATNTKRTAFSVGAVWDLRQLVFNPSEVQVFGLIGVQRDIMLEATRTYYLRKQLILRKVYNPPKDEVARAALDMRIDEFTALLDVLTGGWFSRQSQG